MVWLGKDSCRSTARIKNKNLPTDQRSYISHLSLRNESILRIPDDRPMVFKILSRPLWPLLDEKFFKENLPKTGFEPATFKLQHDILWAPAKLFVYKTKKIRNKKLH